MSDDFLGDIVRKPKVNPPAPSVRERRSPTTLAPLPPSARADAKRSNINDRRTAGLIPATGAIYATYYPERKGRITVPGPEVSEVMWDDGARRFINNEFLKGI